MIEGQKSGLAAAESPDPEVTPKAKRRSFSAPYKKKILAEVEAAAGTGNIGEILRREGIYSSTLTSWRKERDAAVDGAFSRKRGPEPKRNPLTGENEKLRLVRIGRPSTWATDPGARRTCSKRQWIPRTAVWFGGASVF